MRTGFFTPPPVAPPLVRLHAFTGSASDAALEKCQQMFREILTQFAHRQLTIREYEAIRNFFVDQCNDNKVLDSDYDYAHLLSPAPVTRAP